MILLLILLSPLLYWLIKFAVYERHLRKFPGPIPCPIIGTALEFNTTKKNMETLQKYRRKYKGNFRFYLGFEPIVVVTEAKSAEYFLSNTTANACQNKSIHYSFFRKWLKNGLLVSNGDYWKKRRRILTPAFHFNILKEYVKIFDSVGNVLLKNLESSFGKVLNIFPLAKLTSLDIICEAAMGSSVNALLNSDSTYVQSVERMGKIMIERIFSAVQSIEFLYQFTENAKMEKRALKIIHDYTRSVIQKRSDELSGKITTHTKNEKNQAFLDLLLTYSMQGENLSNEDIQEEVDTFMFAGHDTTASTLTFTLYLISKDERVQNKIVEELFFLFKNDPNRAISYEDLQEMKYLDLVIKESLRLYPSVPFHFREVTKELIFDGKTYPKGLTLLIYNYGMHHDPDYFKDPERFYPERFETESNAYRSGETFSYIPFSAGQRNCIGQRFAVLQLKTIISKILRHCKLMPCLDHQLELADETVLISLSGANLRVLPRS